MKKAAIISAIIILGATGVFAETGKSGWAMLRKIQSAQYRTLAATLPGYGNLSGILVNPAMAGTFDRKQFMLISEAGFADDKLGGLLFSFPHNRWSFSGGFAYYDLGSEELYWLESAALMSRTVNVERNYFGMFSSKYDLSKWLCAGLSLKGLNTQLVETYSASAFAADLGVYAVPLKDLSISVALQNIGSAGKFIDADNPLPQSIFAGVGKVFERKNSYIGLAAGVSRMITDEKTVPEAGLELGAGMFSINFGYRFATEGINAHVGTEIVFKDFVFGYAFIPGEYLDGAHRATVAYRFSDPTDRYFEEKPESKGDVIRKPVWKGKPPTTAQIKAQKAKPAAKPTQDIKHQKTGAIPAAKPAPEIKSQKPGAVKQPAKPVRKPLTIDHIKAN